jgi:hypothetical protein
MPGGLIGPKYVLQHLFSEDHKIAENSMATKARKNKHRFGIFRNSEIFNEKHSNFTN